MQSMQMNMIEWMNNYNSCRQHNTNQDVKLDIFSSSDVSQNDATTTFGTDHKLRDALILILLNTDRPQQLIPVLRQDILLDLPLRPLPTFAFASVFLLAFDTSCWSDAEKLWLFPCVVVEGETHRQVQETGAGAETEVLESFVLSISNILLSCASCMSKIVSSFSWRALDRRVTVLLKDAFTKRSSDICCSNWFLSPWQWLDSMVMVEMLSSKSKECSHDDNIIVNSDPFVQCQRKGKDACPGCGCGLLRHLHLARAAQRM